MTARGASMRAVCATLIRSSRPLHWLMDVALLVAAGALVAFVVMYSSRTLFDQVTFDASLVYERRAVADDRATDADLSVQRWYGANAMPVGNPTGGATIGDLWAHHETAAWLYEPADATALRHLLAGTLVAGNLTPDGDALLDVATARALGVEVGDEFVLATLEPTLTECRVRVGGMLRSYAESQQAADALVIVPRDGCAGSAILEAGLEGGNWLVFGGAASMTKAQSLRSAFDAQPATTAVVVAVAGIGSALWILALIRVRHRQDAELGPVGTTLIDLGVRPRTLRFFGALSLSSLGLLAAVTSTWIARATAWGFTSIYIQPEHIGVVATVMTLAGVVIGGLHRRTNVPSRTTPRRADVDSSERKPVS